MTQDMLQPVFDGECYFVDRIYSRLTLQNRGMLPLELHYRLGEEFMDILSPYVMPESAIGRIYEQIAQNEYDATTGV